VLEDNDGKLDIPLRGTEIRIALGWKDTGLIDKGTFTVGDITHSGTPDKLTINATSADLRAGLSEQKERSWHCTTLGIIVAAIAQENQLTPACAADLQDIEIDHIDQTNESDINLLTRLARQFDAFATVKNGKLIFMRSGLAKSYSGKPLKPVTITRADGDQHNFHVSDRNSFTTVKAVFQDIKANKNGEVIIDETNVNTLAPLEDTAPVVSGKAMTLAKLFASKGSATRAAREKLRKLKKAKSHITSVKAWYMDSALGSKQEVMIDDSNLNKDLLKPSHKGAPSAATASAESQKTLRHIYPNKTAATRAAQAEFRRLKRGEAEFSLTLAHGRPELLPDLPATVTGWKPAIDGTNWIISKASHRLSGGGLTTDLEFEIKAAE
jgi:phage protein D